LTVSNYVSEDAPGLVKAAAGVLDFFNPAAVLQDGDVYDVVSSDDEPPEDPKPDESPPGGGS